MKIRILVATLCGLIVAGCGGSNSSPAPINIAPTISAIPDQSASANVSGSPIAFTVTSSTELSYSVTSDNQQVVPDAGIDLESNSGGGSISATPVVDTLGDAFITIIATDQAGLAASTSFLLTVDPQSASMQQFVRDEFAAADDGQAALINAIAFDQDADDDEFADLLAQ